MHVLEAIDPAAAILEFVRGQSGRPHPHRRAAEIVRRALLGSVSAKVAAEAPCTVTVVRPPWIAAYGAGRHGRMLITLDRLESPLSP